MPRYNPEITASIAARAARKLFAIEGRGSKQDNHGPGISKFDISNPDISKSDISKIDTPERDYCKVHNWLFDELPKKLSQAEWIVFMQIYRLSIGYNSDRCTIGYGGLADRTGMSRTTAYKTVKNLIEKGYLTVVHQDHSGSTLIPTVPNASVLNFGISKIDISKTDISESDIPKSDIPSVSKSDISKSNTPVARLEKSTKIGGISKSDISNSEPIKDNNIDNNKDNNKELLLSFFDQTPFEPITPEALEFLSQYEYDTVVRCARAVLAWPNTRNPMALLRAALKGGYRFPEGKRDSKEDSEIRKLIEEQARKAEEEEEAFLRFKESLPDGEKENIAKRVRESLADDPFYRRIKSTEMMKKYADGKLEGELRKMFAQLGHK